MIKNKIKMLDFITEKDIERNILYYLKINNICAWKQNNGALKVNDRFVKFFMDENGRIVRGMPDIAGYLPGGKALFIEVKKKKGRITTEQNNFINNSSEAGCIAFIARNTDDVIKKLKPYLKKLKNGVHNE